VLKRTLGLSDVNLIFCGGGDEIASAREQWNDGSNTLAIAPGVVVTYDRNYISNECLREQGIKVIEIPSGELSRGRGGPALIQHAALSRRCEIAKPKEKGERSMNQTIDLKGRSYLAEKDFSEEEILYLLDLAQKLKEKKAQGIKHRYLEGKNIALLFEKPSTRTRCAFTTCLYRPRCASRIFGQRRHSARQKRIDRRHSQSSRPHVRRN
jgi:hypothetical protein